MKRDTKIFITCLVVGMWSLNLGMVNFRGASGITLDTVTGVGGMALGVLLLIYGVIQNGDDTN